MEECIYQDEKGVEKDEKKIFFHFENATIGGHPDAGPGSTRDVLRG